MKTTSKQIIVLVDDEAEILDLHRIRLNSLGCDFLTFSNPEGFISYLNQHPDFNPDLVISDFMMPGMTGVEMIQKAYAVRNYFPSILLSGFVDKDKAIQATNSGFWNILEKPVAKETLVQLSQRMLLESKMRKLSQEMKNVTSQLSEIFSAFRILCMNELELESMKKPLIHGNPSNSEDKAISLEQRLEELESHLMALALKEKEISKNLTSEPVLKAG